MDISDRELVYKTAGDVQQHFGQVDVVVNNAAVISGLSTFLASEDERNDRVIDVNLKSMFWVRRRVSGSGNA